MAKIYCKSSYLLRRDTAENWKNKNPILRKGEQGLETDTGIMKIGDGVTAFNSLSDDNIYFPKSRINKSVDDVKSYVNNNFANALKGSASGSAILIDDISPVTHNMGVKVRGKNLCVDVSNRTDVFFSGSPTTTYSITGEQLIKGFAVNGNSTNYHITDFVNSNGIVSFKTSNVNYTIGIDVRVVQGKTYTVSANIMGGAGGSSPIWIIFLKDGLFQSYTTAQSFTVPNNCNQAILLIRPSAANTECSFSNVQLELGTTATAYTPYVPDLTAVKVSRCGKNLFDKDNANILNTYFTASGDALNTNSTTTKSVWIPCLPNTTYTVSKMASARFSVGFTNEEPMNGVTVNNVTFLPTATKITVTSGNSDKYIIVWFYHSSHDTSVTVEEILASMQIELGATATDYEPYIAPTEYTPAADGTVNGVTSLYPNTTLTTDTDGVIIDCEYNRDINKAFAELQQAIISLGGNV